ncbi:hypothetical protein GY12_23620 [Micrococcus luteus]|nr:hypothetical protein GY12_23620 [Micrococcus luteus]
MTPEQPGNHPSSVTAPDAGVAPDTSAAVARDRVLLPWVFWPSAVIVLSFVGATLLAPRR